eukprot:TRINITY_DN3657_c0_g1_i4.p1 TRINITY_DN3657_c0_g1~~TRINITY_DN3657_c0_g1_i4.p1  ORF type:complete len:197 (+),score=22.34 TRINITY_DN3657_c0_g1_i4:396-986(+)
MAMGSTSLEKNWNVTNEVVDPQNWKVHGYYPEFREFVHSAIASIYTTYPQNWKVHGYYPEFREFVHSAIASIYTTYPHLLVSLGGIFWMQGESDSGIARSAYAYPVNLRALIDKMYQDFNNGEELPFVMGKINWRPAKKQAVINGAMSAIATERPSCVAVVETADLEVLKDHHFGSPALLQLGSRMAESFKRLLKK